MATVLCVPVKIVDAVGRDPDVSRRVACETADIHLHIIVLVTVAAVVGVKERKAFFYHIDAMGIVRAVQRIDVRIGNALGQRAVLYYLYTLGSRDDVLELSALVVRTSAPVAHLLDIPHIKLPLVGKETAHFLGHGTKLVAEVGKKQTPKP